MISKRTSAQPVEHLRMTVDGRPVIATPVGDSVAFQHDGGFRCSVTTRDPNKPIALTTEPDDEQLNWQAAERVKQAAARAPGLRSERPSAHVAAARKLARQHHETTWRHGYNEGQARYEQRPLADRVTEKDVPELVALAMRAVLSDPELRDELRAALDSADVDEALTAELAS